MIKTIGFRAEKDAINWAVVSDSDGDNPVIEEHGVIKAPGTYKGDAEVLTYFRSKVREALTRYEPVAAGIRYPETFGKAPRFLASAYSRCRVEGVIAEVVGSENVRLIAGGLQKIGKEMKSDSAKAYIDPKADEVRGIKFAKKDAKYRESVLAAVAALEGTRASSS